jgi:predicted permease
VRDPDELHEIEGDFVEMFAGRKKRSGKVSAYARLWLEIFALFVWRAVTFVRNGKGNAAMSWSMANQTTRLPFGELLSDLKFGFRTLARTPGLTAVSLVILSVAIGANTTIFSVINTVFLEEPPHVVAPSELVAVHRLFPDGVRPSFGYPDYEYYRDEADFFEGMLAYDGDGTTVSVGIDDRVQTASLWGVSVNFFEVLNVPAEVGRTFVAAEGGVPGVHQQVTVVSHAFWARQLGGESSAIGSTIALNGSVFEIIGVMPVGFRGINPVENPPDFYIPITSQDVVDPGFDDMLYRSQGDITTWLRVLGRLKPGVELETAAAQMDVLHERWRSEYASWIESVSWAESWDIGLSSDYRLLPSQAAELDRLLTLLAVVVGVVLLIASANIAILMLARAAGRTKEIGVRAALGASRARLLRQLLTESLVLSLTGGVLGFGLARLGVDLAAGLFPYEFSSGLAPDITVLSFTIIASVGAAVLFGLAPAIQLTNRNVVGSLSRSGRPTRGASLQNVLVVGQVALSIILVSGAVLFLQSLQKARSVDLGFDPEGKALFTVNLYRHGYDDDRGRIYVSNVLESLQAHPGVTGVTTTRMVPFRGSRGGSVTAAGTAYEESGLDVGKNRVGPDYFDIMGIPILSGRGFDRTDVGPAASSVVVNQRTAETLWPAETAIGKTVEGRTVIGVTANATYYEIAEELPYQVYTAQLEDHGNAFTFMVRTNGDPSASLASLQGAIQKQDGSVAVYRVSTLLDIVHAETAGFRVVATLVGLFAFVALFLATVGLYGVQSFLVSQRNREIGVRMALGALREQVARGVMRSGFFKAGAGVVLGVAGSLVLGGYVRSMLFGVEPQDPTTLVVVPILLLVVAVLANLIPALRASRVDPATVLREE